MTTKEDHKAIRDEWRRDRARDTFREAQMDEGRLQELAIRKELEDLKSMGRLADLLPQWLIDWEIEQNYQAKEDNDATTKATDN